MQVAEAVADKIPGVRCWLILESISDRASAHSSSAQRSSQNIYSSLGINSSLSSSFSKTETLCLLDDVLTSGASFSACRQKLLDHFSAQDVMGIFWAKSQYPDAHEEDEL